MKRTESNPEPGRARNALALAVAVLLMAALLRLYQLDHHGLWDDEGLSYARAIVPVSKLWRQLPAEQMPLYYLLLNGWTRLFGATLLSMRLLSALWGTVAVAVVLQVGRAWSGPRTGLAAATLMALSPTMIYQAQTVRMYPMMTALLLLAVYLGSQLARKPSKLLVGAYIACGVAASWTHLTALLGLAALGAYGLWQRRHEPRRLYRWLAWHGIMVTSVALWPLVAWVGAPSDEMLGSVGGSGIALPAMLAQWASLLVAAPTDPMTAQHPWAALPLLLLAMVAPLLHRRQHQSRGWPLVYWIPAFSLLAIYVLGRLTEAPLYWHYLAPLAPWVYLAAGMALAELGGWRVSGLVVWVIAALALCGFLGVYAGREVEDLAPLAAAIEARAQPGDVIVHSSRWRALCFRYYDHTGLPSTAEPDAEALRRLLQAHDRIWLLVYGYHPTPAIAETLMGPAYEIENWAAGTTVLRLYRPPSEVEPEWIQIEATFGDNIRLLSYALTPPGPGNGYLVQLDLRWTLVEPLDIGYKVFIHVRDQAGMIWGQRDAQPADGTQPTWLWEPGEIIEDHHAFRLEPGVPPGTYGLFLGLYEGSDRLAVEAPAYDVASNALRLETVTVPTP